MVRKVSTLIQIRLKLAICINSNMRMFSWRDLERFMPMTLTVLLLRLLVEGCRYSILCIAIVTFDVRIGRFSMGLGQQLLPIYLSAFKVLFPGPI